MRIRTVAVAAGLLLTACAGDDAAQACGPVEHPELQGGSHLIGDAEPPVPYSSTPGTSGWHASGQPPTGVIDRGTPLTDTQIVASLEAGQVVAAYDPDGLAADQVDELERLARDRFSGQLTVAPFTQDMGAPLVLNAWATRQPCSRVDTDVIASLIDRLGDTSTGH
ncbi:MAG: DUF3105 domain-containing protein [Nitriliruptorales bacterium]